LLGFGSHLSQRAGVVDGQFDRFVVRQAEKAIESIARKPGWQ
jgi:hypothetical protein